MNNGHTARPSQQDFSTAGGKDRSLRRSLLHQLAQPELLESIRADQGWLHVREQILTGLLRVAALLGLLTFLIATMGMLEGGLGGALVFQGTVLALIWLLALRRQLSYWLRSGALLLGMYALGLHELLQFGYNEDAHAFFVGFSLLSMLFLGSRVGVAALVISVTSIGAMGWLIYAGLFTTWGSASLPISASTIATTSSIFLLVVGTAQVGIAVLLRHLEQSVLREQHARLLLEQHQQMLEQRVAERTSQLAEARDAALAAGRRLAEQNNYLAALHQTTLDLLNRREPRDLLQAIVERAAEILEAPYVELMLAEGDELVVHAFTRNQPFLQDERVRRDEALLSWQAHDTGQAVVLDDYSAWQSRRVVYEGLQLRAVADLPILSGGRSIGVLALARVVPGLPFTPEEVQQGALFSRLVALVLDNANLYATALREIHERSLAEQALQQQAQELRLHNDELAAFAHTVAHDLKNPLTSLLGFSQFLLVARDKLEPDEVEDFLRRIEGGGQKMSRIINELLLLASVRTLDDIPVTEFSMDDVLSDLELRLHDLISRSRATIVRPDRWPLARGYAPWIEEVWANYISNAIKYGGNPPHITIGADTQADGTVRFWVRDNGQGLSAEQQAQLFTPFTRLHADRAQGHGLGLSIVQRIVTRLGGTVGVESAPGQGSTFFFTLPAVEELRLG